MKKISVFLAEGFEEIEALSVVDICRRAGIEVKTVSVTGHKQVMGAHGIAVHADEVIDNIDFNEIDGIVLPGGMPGTLHLGEHAGVVEQVKAFAQGGKMTAAICAAPSVLANAGVLNEKHATVYPGCEVDRPEITWLSDAVVRTDNIITGKGPGVAAVFALTVAEYLVGEEVAEEVRAGLMLE